MPEIGKLKKGDIVYAPFSINELKDNLDYENPGKQILLKAKDRPCLILFRGDGENYTICAITSKSGRKYSIQINSRDLDTGNLEDYRASYIRPNIISTVSKKLMRKKVGTLRDDKLEEAIEYIKEFLDREPEEDARSKVFQRPKKPI